MKIYCSIAFLLITFTAVGSITNLRQRSITSSGFAVKFSSSPAGVGVVKYGLTPDNGSVVSNGNQGFTHEIALSNLVPATLYYVRGGVVISPGDTLYSDFEPMMTASLSSGDIKVYFNGDVDTEEATLSEAISLGQDFPDTIIAYLDRAKYTVDIAIYNMDNQNGVISAINAAHDRGVEVRLVTDEGMSDSNFNSIDIGPGNKIKSPTGSTPNGSFYGLMHNKFVIIDSESDDPADPVLIAGSTNFTDNQLRNDPNNLIIFQDQSIARGFKIEFEEMFGGTFGPMKTIKTPKEFSINGKRVEVHFSPKSGVEDIVLEKMEQADHDFYFGMFTHTRPNISETIATRVFEGLFVAGIIDQINTSSSEYSLLSNSLGNRFFVDDLPYTWHHKYVIFDPNCPEGDPMIYTGSANWSNNGNLRSDENVVIVHDADIANQYYQEFMARYKANGGNQFVSGDCEVVSSTAENNADYNRYLYSFPNPSTGSFLVHSSMNGHAVMSVFNATGQEVFRSNIALDGTPKAVEIPSAVPGLYFLKLNGVSGSWSETTKLIINR